MGLDDHYDRAYVEQERAAARVAAEQGALSVESLIGEWNGLLGRLGGQMGSDIARFIAAMKRHRGKRGEMPGAKFEIKTLPLRMYKTTWYWELCARTVNLSGPPAHRPLLGRLVLTARGTLVIDVRWKSPGRAGSVHKRFASEAPREMLRNTPPMHAIAPTASDISAQLAEILHAHAVLLE